MTQEVVVMLLVELMLVVDDELGELVDLGRKMYNTEPTVTKTTTIDMVNARYLFMPSISSVPILC
jgi:hypothetical protein